MISILLVQIFDPSRGWVDVGQLRHENEVTQFESFTEYWGMDDRPILGRIFEERGPDYRPATHTAIPHWFSHLLPEGSLRRAVATATSTNMRREFQLLSRIGAADLPGAVRVIPSSKRHNEGTQQISIQRDLDDALDMADSILKYSLDGVQLKFSLQRDEKGLVVPARGQSGSFIVKFPDSRLGFKGVPEAEYAALSLARAAGFDVPVAELVDPKSIRGLEYYSKGILGNALAVTRFDRGPDGRRIHTEELAQVINTSPHRYWDKYRKANFETIANIVAAFAGTSEVERVIERIVLNILVGNGDAHLKNWAFRYVDGRRARLAPLYDVVPTVLFIKNDDLGLNLAGTKIFTSISASSFEVLGDRSGYGASEAHEFARRSVGRILEHWSTFTGLLSKENAAMLDARLETLPLVRRP